MATSRINLEQISDGFRLEVGPSQRPSDKFRFLIPMIMWVIMSSIVILFMLWAQGGSTPSDTSEGTTSTDATWTLVTAIFAFVLIAGFAAQVFFNIRMIRGTQRVEVSGGSLRASKWALRNYAVRDFPLDSVERIRINTPDPRKSPQYFGPCRMQVDVGSKTYTLISGLRPADAQELADTLRVAISESVPIGIPIQVEIG